MTSQYWIYHERQDALLCGQHALNNLLQKNEFTPDILSEIARQLDQMELAYMSQNDEGGINSKDYLKRLAEGSGNVDESGNFSIEVLRSALMTRHGLELPNIRQQGVNTVEITNLEGFICNRSSHWFAIRKINGRFWNLNSTNDRPELISHFNLAKEMEGLQNAGYSVFCVVDKLPASCTSEAMMDQGLPQYWWKESDLLQGKTNAMTRNEDPWKDVGSGRRLDGKPKNGSGNGHRPIHELSEEEQLQAAIQASMMDNNTSETGESSGSFLQELLSMDVQEPASGARVQIRMPGGAKLVRKFNGDDPVKAIYAFVAQSSDEAKAGKSFGLKAKFPPQELLPSIDSSISDCGLNGEAINVSWK